MSNNSINTNYGAQVALQTLNATNSALNTTQNRISTGLKVNSAADDSAVYSIAQGLRSQNTALDAVTASLNRGVSTVGVATTAGSSISDLLTQAQATVLAASDTSLDQTSRNAYQQKYQSLASQIQTYVKNASFNGVNLLDGSTASYSALANSDGTSKITVGGQNLNFASGTATSAQLTGVGGPTVTTAGTFKVSVNGAAAVTVNVAAGDSASTIATAINAAVGGGFTGATVGDNGAIRIKSAATGSASSVALTNFTGGVSQSSLGFQSGSTGLFAEGQDASTGGGAIIQVTGTETFDNNTDYTGLITKLKASITGVSTALGSLGTASNAFSNHLTFVSKLQDSLTTGIGNLVDADVAKESANLTALQTKQQLGVQALSIANSSSSVLLSLFRG